MERIRNWFYTQIQSIDTSFKRYLWFEIDWDPRLIILVGARGVGKTTMILQYIKTHLPINEQTIYVSLDDIYFSNHTLIDFTQEFVHSGGRFLFLDEAQKYPNWSREVKSIYDNFPDIKIVVSGSSTIELLLSEGDLSRRALYYKLNGLSFREYLNFENNKKLKSYSLEEILNDGLQINLDISHQIKVYPAFNDYKQFGYYPFYKTDTENYHKRLQQVINTVLDVDIPDSFQIETGATHKIKKLLAEIANLVPFKPNIKKLSEQIGITRDTLVKYLQLLEKADLLRLVYSKTKGVSALNKPEKILFNNPNIAYSINSSVNIVSLRESYFASQLTAKHQLRYTDAGDFMVDDKWTFEVGGKGKSQKQIAHLQNAWVAADDIDYVQGNKLPLWLFGFLY